MATNGVHSHHLQELQPRNCRQLTSLRHVMRIGKEHLHDARGVVKFWQASLQKKFRLQEKEFVSLRFPPLHYGCPTLLRMYQPTRVTLKTADWKDWVTSY